MESDPDWVWSRLESGLFGQPDQVRFLLSPPMTGRWQIGVMQLAFTQYQQGSIPWRPTNTVM